MKWIGSHSVFAPAEKTFAERVVHSINKAIENTELSLSDGQTALIISSTKGEDLDLIKPSSQVAEILHYPNTPIVVSNACTSGVCAQIVAARLLQSKQYKAVVVTGCDLITEFIRSGFDVLHALSKNPARPFDIARDGLNLGEAVATMVFVDDNHPSESPCWHYESGSIHNDANHISGPSRTGEGSYLCLQDVLKDTTIDTIAMIGLHGTGTLYNDEMESIAIHRAGLDQIPVNSFKGGYGHTLGAAGLLETILCLHSLEKGIIPSTKGYETQGTTYSLSVSSEERYFIPYKGMQFIKLLSGFGGTNAAVRYKWQ